MTLKAQFIRRASAVPNLVNIGFDRSTAQARLQFRRRARVELKGAVSWQSSSFCLILPINRPQPLWNLK